MTDKPNTIFTPCDFKEGILLIVEDDIVSLEVMKQIIKREGIDFVTASTGEEALSILDNNINIKAIVTDVVLPGISGIGLARSVHEKNHEMAFLFNTAICDASSSNLMWQHGIVYNKPIKEDFPAALRRLIMCATAQTKATENCEIGGHERRIYSRRDSDVIK